MVHDSNHVSIAPLYREYLYDIRVSDSAPARHSDDTRSPHSSGVGIGTLMLKENPETHEPDAYAWTLDSGWKRIDAVMAEPVSTNS